MCLAKRLAGRYIDPNIFLNQFHCLPVVCRYRRRGHTLILPILLSLLHSDKLLRFDLRRKPRWQWFTVIERDRLLGRLGLEQLLGSVLHFVIVLVVSGDILRSSQVTLLLPFDLGQLLLVGFVDFVLLQDLLFFFLGLLHPLDEGCISLFHV